MFETISLRVKLIAAIMIAGIICLVSINIGSYYLSRRYFLHASFDSFTAIREIKKQQIESYFQQIRNQCYTFAQDTMIVNAMKEFKQTFYKANEGDKYSKEQITSFTDGLKNYYQNEFLARLNPNVDVRHTVEEYFKNISLETIIWQHFYIVANPNPTGKKDNLTMADDGSAYSKWHGKYHPIIREFLKKFGYYDVFLIDIENGNIVYTVFKEVDYTTSLITGPFKNSNFAQVFLAVQETLKKDDVKIVDFAYYDPSYGAPAAFIAAPIFDRDKKIGVLAFQFPIDKINQIMTNDKKWKETGLGNSGEMYLIGQDYKMRTVSRFLEEDPKTFFTSLEQSGVSKQVIDKIKLLKTTILIQEINTKAAHEVMQGNSGTILTTNYRNIPVVSSFAPLAIEGLKWGLIAEIDESEVVAPVKKLMWATIGWGCILLFILIIFAIFVVRMIVTPIKKIIAMMRNIVRKKDIHLQGDLVIASNDEIAELASLLNLFIEEIRKKINAITTTKKELRTIANKMMHTTEPLQIQDTQTHALMGQTMQTVNELDNYFATMMQGTVQYQQHIQDMTQLAEQIGLSIAALNQSNESARRNVGELQQGDQKLLAVLEKEIFDMRQTIRYLDEGVIATAKSIVKTMLTDAENAAGMTRIASSMLQQLMLLCEDDHLGYQKMTHAMSVLKKQLASIIEQLQGNRNGLQKEHTKTKECMTKLEKIEEISRESSALAGVIIDTIKMLNNRIDELDEIIKRFS